MIELTLKIVDTTKGTTVEWRGLLQNEHAVQADYIMSIFVNTVDNAKARGSFAIAEEERQGMDALNTKIVRWVYMGRCSKGTRTEHTTPWFPADAEIMWIGSNSFTVWHSEDHEEYGFSQVHEIVRKETKETGETTHEILTDMSNDEDR